MQRNNTGSFNWIQNFERFVVISSFFILAFALTSLSQNKIDVSTVAHFTNVIQAQRRNVEMDTTITNISASTFCHDSTLLCSNTKIQPLQKLTLEDIHLKEGVLSSWISTCKPVFFYVLSVGFFLQTCMISYDNGEEIKVGFNWRFAYFVIYSIWHAAIIAALIMGVWFHTVIYTQFAFVFPLIFVYLSNTINNFRNMFSDNNNSMDSTSGLTFYNKRYLQDVSAFSAASNSCMFLFLLFVYNSQLYMTMQDITLSFSYFLASQLLMNIAFHVELKSSDLEITNKLYMLIVLISVAVSFLAFSWINVFESIVVFQGSVKHLSYNSRMYHIGLVSFFFVAQVIIMGINIVVLFYKEKQNSITWTVLFNRFCNFFFIMYGLYVVGDYVV